MNTISRFISLVILSGFVCTAFFASDKLCAAETSQLPMYELEDVIYVAGRVATGLNTTGRSVEVLTQDDIEASSYFSVEELIQLVQGVDVRRRCPHGVQADLSIRGGSFDQTLVMIDGLPVNDPQTGHHNMDIPVSTNDIERIEIL
ncbi:MAG: TonB-dependent receptor plug domain-containing protein [Candidatus Electryonea clarkiae]|nr:TonB-dependent receptor plug domain-containing protein [Candidatus Electryonea clarkiae]MDP8288096.1 TonB-dependent receptor plug domain-containing protein [Candidatus Electryonea clarkiae]